MLGTLVSETRALSLLSDSDTGDDWRLWAQSERGRRLGLAVFTLDASSARPSFGLGEVASTPMPDGDRWLASEEAWRALPPRQSVTIGDA